MARATLAECYIADGRWPDFMDTIDQLEKLEAVRLRPEELLFKARVLRFGNPDQALEWIEKVIDDHGSSSLARLSRADQKIYLAVDRGRVEHALEALDDLRVLSRDLDDNPAVRASRLKALLSAYTLYERQGASEQATRYFEEAEADVAYLEDFGTFHSGNMNRLAYYRFQSDFDAMFLVVETAAESGGNADTPLVLLCPAFFNAGPKRVQKALDWLDRLSIGAAAIFARAVLLTETPSGRKEAEAICDELISRSPEKLGLPGRGTWDVILQSFLGRDEQSVQEYAAKRRAGLADSIFSSVANLDLRYLSGEISADEFLRHVEGSSNIEGIAYLSIGMRQLAAGRRRDAKESFRKSSHGGFLWLPSMWSGAFFARMEADPGWPDWLPAKPDDPEAK